MASDDHLVQKALRIPRHAVAQQGQVHVTLARQHAVELAEHGWSVDDTNDLEGNVGRLLAQVGAKEGARHQASAAVQRESEAVDRAKAFIRQVRLAAPRAIRDLPDAGVTMKSLASPERVQRQTPRIVGYLSGIRPAVVQLDPALRKAFSGASAVARLDEVLGGLLEADSAQELARKEGPAFTRALLTTTGRVLEQIEDLNRVAKIAFAGAPEAAAKFDKAIIARALPPRKRGKAAKAKAAPPAS